MRSHFHYFYSRPGMIGWILMDISFIATQYHRYGYVTMSLILVSLFHAIYVLDALWSEVSA